MNTIKNTLSLSIAICLLVLLTSCNHSKSKEEKTENDTELKDSVIAEASEDYYIPLEEQALVRMENSLSLKIFQKVTTKERNKNVFISSWGIFYTLSILNAGAIGESRMEICKVLDIDSSRIEKINEFNHRIAKSQRKKHEDDVSGLSSNLTSGCALILRNDTKVSPTFAHTFEHYYDGKIIQSDSDEKTRRLVNEWCRRMSDGQIENFHIESGAQGVLAVINNFYGKWEKAFDAKYTKEETFHRGNSKTVMMMNDTDSDRRLTIAQHPDYSMLRIPYRDGYNMYVILPKKWKSLNSVISKLNENDIEACNSFSDYDEIIVKLPKFEMNYAWNANKVLKEMGVRKIFTKTAELNHINDSLYISNIIQKTKVKVDESGTDASAATGVVLKLKEIKEKKVTNFYADHPFAYIIADPFGNYCFMGTFWGYKK